MTYSLPPRMHAPQLWPHQVLLPRQALWLLQPPVPLQALPPPQVLWLLQVLWPHQVPLPLQVLPPLQALPLLPNLGFPCRHDTQSVKLL